MLPLVEVRADFELSLEELRDFDRGAADADLAPLDMAAHQMAVAENIAVFHGWEGAVAGISEVARTTRSRSATSPTSTRVRSPPPSSGCSRTASRVRTRSRSAGRCTSASSRRPSTVATRCSSTCTRSSTVRSCGRRASRGAVVISLRGGDFLFESGQDLSLGYTSHDANVVRLYLEQSFSFHVATPEAAVVLTA